MPVLVGVPERALAEHVETTLRAAGHSPVTFPDPAAALAEQRASRYAAIVLTVSGAADLHHLNVLHSEGNPTIVALAGDDDLGLRALTLGAEDYLPPYDAGLVPALRKALVRRMHDPGHAWAAMLDGSSDAVVVVDHALVVRRFNHAAERLYGRAAADVIGHPVAQLAPEDRHAQQEEALRRTLEGESLSAYETVRYRLDGTTVNVSISCTPIVAVDGRVLGAGAILRDITELVSARDLLAREHARLEASQAAGQVGSWELDLATMVTEWSAENALLHGLAPLSRRLSITEMCGYVHPDDHAAIDEAMAGRGEFTLEYRVVTVPDDERVLVSRGAWLPGEDGHPGYLTGTSHDVTAERAAWRAKELADEQFRRAFESGIVAMAIADPEFRYVRVNDAFCDFFDRSRDRLLGRSMRDLVHANDAASYDAVLETLSSGAEASASGQVRYRLPDRRVVWGDVSVSAVRPAEADGAIEYVVQLRDVTAVRTQARALRRLADQDPLTSVLNRRGFDRQLRRHLDRAGRGAVLMLDLDGFKGYNDAFGHPAGDGLLTEIAHSLNEHLRANDVIARLGGDEFVILLPGADRVAIDIVAPRLVAAVRDASVRVAPHLGRPVTASVGIAEIVDDRPADVLRRADEALYEAKAQGRDTWVLAAAR